MSVSAAETWEWFRLAHAAVDNGYIVGEQGEAYRPAEHLTALLSEVANLHGEEDVVRFVSRWGPLGSAWSIPDYGLRIRDVAFALHHHGKDLHEAFEWAVVHFGPQRDRVSDIIGFSERVRLLVRAREILQQARDDELAAAYETEEWIDGLSEAQFRELTTTSRALAEGRWPPSKLAWVKRIVASAQSTLSTAETRRIWVELDYHSGMPRLQFDCLGTFVLYHVLSSRELWVGKCEACGRLFVSLQFRRFCPPEPGQRHSRCENRWRMRKQRHPELRAVTAGRTPRKLTDPSVPDAPDRLDEGEGKP